MIIRIVHGGSLNKDNTILSKLVNFVNLTPRSIELVDIGSKATRLALKRQLADPTVSAVLLAESDYETFQTSLSDDRLVCVYSEDTVYNLFKAKFGLIVEEEIVNEVEDNIVDTSSELEKDETSIDSSGLSDSEDAEDTSSDVEELDWQELIKEFDVLTGDVKDEEPEVLETEPTFTSVTDESTAEEVDEVYDTDDSLISTETEEDEEKDNEPSEIESQLRRVIDDLSERNKQLSDELLETVAVSDYRELEGRIVTLTTEYGQLKTHSEGVEQELTELKPKFAEMLDRLKKTKTIIEGIRNEKAQKTRVLGSKYPNITVLTALSSDAIEDMYKYIANRDDNFLFVDLTNNSFVDRYISISKVTRPSKWLFEGLPYKRVIATTTSNPNIRLISSLAHFLDYDKLADLDWDKLFGDFALESKVVINLGSIYDNNVLRIVKSVQDGVSVKGYLGSTKISQRNAKLALDNLNKCGVIASKETKDYFSKVTEIH